MRVNIREWRQLKYIVSTERVEVAKHKGRETVEVYIERIEVTKYKGTELQV